MSPSRYSSWTYSPHADPRKRSIQAFTRTPEVDDDNHEVFSLDELNECVNFYFEVARERTGCTVCGETGYHPDGLWVSESFYSSSSPFKEPSFQEKRAMAVLDGFRDDPRPKSPLRDERFPSEALLAKYGEAFRDFCEEMRVCPTSSWSDRITQDELEALHKENRLCDWDPIGKRWTQGTATLEAVNAANGYGEQRRNFDLNHDAINRSILIGARLTRFGMPHQCSICEGHGYVFTAERAHVNLILWILHPRKGCSRGAELTDLPEQKMPAILAWLRRAAERNAERFGRLAEELT